MTTRTVIGQYLNIDGTPVKGYLEFTPTSTVAQGYIIPVSTVRISLDDTGSFSVDLPVTDNPIAVPVGWKWSLEEKIPNGNHWYFDLPTSGTPLNLADVVVISDDSVPIYGVAGPKGAKGDTGNTGPMGEVTTAQLTAGLAPKADKTYVDSQDALKANITYVDSYRPYAGRNLARNGAMRISQRGSSQAASAGANATDGWLVSMNADATMIASQQITSPPVGFRHYARQLMNTADASLTGDQYSNFYSVLEGSWLAFLEWGTANAKPVTLSFWIRTSIGGIWSGSIRSQGSAASYVFTFTTMANVWEYKTITIPGATIGTWGKDLDQWGSIVFCQGFSSTCIYRATTANSWLTGNYIGHSSQTNMVGTVGATFDITGVQLEEGLLATPFEHKSYDQDMREAQRYFQRWTQPPLRGVVGASGNYAARMSMPLPTPMRSTPSPSLGGGLMGVYDGGLTTTISSIGGLNYSTPTVCELEFNLSAGITAYRPCMIYQNGSAYLDLTAEP